MGECFLTRSGGSSGGSAFGYIVASFPAGTVSCTCTNAGTVLQADSTGLAQGEYTFEVVRPGTWTVTATDGTNTKSQEVIITATQQVEEVTLAYWSGELYDAGNQYTDITGGWKSIKGKVTFNEDSITISAAESSEAIVGTTNAIDLSGFTTLKVTVVVPADYRNLGGSIKLWNLDTNKAVSSVEYNKTLTDKTSVTTLDISAINEPCQVRMYATYLYPYNHTFNITKVIMEAAV